jgi:hypothetical protein
MIPAQSSLVRCCGWLRSRRVVLIVLTTCGFRCLSPLGTPCFHGSLLLGRRGSWRFGWGPGRCAGNGLQLKRKRLGVHDHQFAVGSRQRGVERAASSVVAGEFGGLHHDDGVELQATRVTDGQDADIGPWGVVLQSSADWARSRGDDGDGPSRVGLQQSVNLLDDDTGNVLANGGHDCRPWPVLLQCDRHCRVRG